MDAETERSLADCRRVIDFLCVADRVGRSVGRTDERTVNRGLSRFGLSDGVKKAIKVDGGSDV